MKADLSAFMDGELEAGSRNGPLETLARDPALRRTWDEYQLIGDALRGIPQVDVHVVDRVMTRLADEPTVLAPAAIAPSRRHGRLRHALPVAASLVGVTVVAWLAISVNTPRVSPVATLSPPIVPEPVQLTKSPEPAAPAELVSLATPSQVKPYLFAHQGYSPGAAIRGVAQYVRTVSDSGEGSAR
jgi:sigma-E factor negative regulatory protein RseA